MRRGHNRPSLLHVGTPSRRDAKPTRRRSRPSRQGHLWLWMVFAVACVAAFLGTYAYMEPALASWLVVRNVVMLGLHEVERKDVMTRLALGSDPSILSLDLQAVKERVEKHPWVATAAVGRVLPDTLTIEIVERVPAARVRQQAATVILDQEGVIVPNPSQYSVMRLPILEGLDLKAVHRGELSIRRRLQQGIQVSRHLSGRFAGVPRVDLGDAARIVGEVRGYRFLFGQNIDEQWAQFLVLEESIKTGLRTKGKEIDLRFPGKVIVRERG